MFMMVLRMWSRTFLPICFILFGSSAATRLGSNMTNEIRQNETAVDLFDFTSLPGEAFNLWDEQSDIVRTVGMSKAILTRQKTQIFQRAVFFTLLNPQPNGAGFAGVRQFTSLNLSSYRKLLIRCRGQGENFGYKIVLRHRGEDDEPFPTYEQMFQAPKNTFAVVDLPLESFAPYYRGKPAPSIPLDTANITSFGFQVYGGVYMPQKQSGASSLEIDWVRAE